MSLPTLEYNGTAPDGGDSCRLPHIKSRTDNSDHGSQSLVHHGRYCMDFGFNCIGLAYDPRGRILLLRPCQKKIRAFAHLAFSYVNSDNIISGMNRLSLEVSND